MTVRQQFASDFVKCRVSGMVAQHLDDSGGSECAARKGNGEVGIRDSLEGTEDASRVRQGYPWFQSVFPQKPPSLSFKGHASHLAQEYAWD